MTDRTLIELIELFGEAMAGVESNGQESANSNSAEHRADFLFSEIRQRLDGLEKDAARFQYLQNVDKTEAQAFFWHYQSRKQRSKAIDAAMEQSK